ncbi:MAG: PhzF family phenazine biosynthesis protein [Eudoraea sp.]|nr:PhzF family phenazine biosynthesis protein [Eudoraea sp.]
MKQTMYQVDAFADQLFSGNPAAVCVLDSWLPDEVMQKIAMENNLAETAFLVKEENRYLIRWFTPEIEVDLCGHATLASAFVLFHYYNETASTLQLYSSRSGELSVTQESDGYLTLNFPTDELADIAEAPYIIEALGSHPIKIFKGKTDYMLIYNSQKEVEKLTPNFFLLDKVPARGVIVTAPGNDVDFISRFFAPQCGISEDPVTGSAHTSLTPYWAKVLGKNKLIAKQLSSRGGTILCEYLGDRIKISGKVVPYLEGEIIL